MGYDNTNTGLGLCCGTHGMLEKEAAGITQWRSHTGAPRWHKTRSGGWTQTASNHSLSETFQHLPVTGLETPPVAVNCSCTSKAAFRSAFCVLANSNASKPESDIKACTQYSLGTSCDRAGWEETATGAAQHAVFLGLSRSPSLQKIQIKTRKPKCSQSLSADHSPGN